jgi:SDR family mycofactocin-dependent oxidoreductase
LREEARILLGSLSGKVAFITGAARGQGRAHAVRLASEGAAIIAVDLCDQITSVPYPMATPDDLNATVKLVEETGARIVAQEADVRDRAALKTALKAGVEELGGRLDIVIANAGIAPMAGEDAWQDVIDVNLTGVYHTVDVGMRPMIKAGNGGAIVLTSSVAGLVGLAAPQAGSIGYAAAKHGIVGLMRVYANLLGSLDIRVNSIHPAGVRTPMIENEFTRKWLEDMANDVGGNSSIQMDTIEAEDIANTVAWLVSDAARHITGVTLPVDAGYTNRR